MDTACQQGARIAIFDTVRGATIISMVAFHGAYDLAYLYGASMPWFTQGVFQDVWRASISWAFLLLAGWMVGLSKNNFKRAGRYGIAALLIWVVTTLASVDSPISFGIIFCMAGSTFIAAVLNRLPVRFPPAVMAATSLLAFFATWSIPTKLYSVGGLAWLGFPSAGFYSGDYYPLIPFCFMYLAGMYLQRIYADHSRSEDDAPAWAYRDYCPPLTAIGRHSLLIYLLHQPILLALCEFASMAGFL